MASRVVAVIPARLGSKRFKGKVIHPFLGKPLLYYVWNSARKSRQIDRLVIATDNREIKKAAEGFGAEVLMTSKRHKCGSDRVVEVAESIRADIYLNIQADNLGLRPAVLDRVIGKMKSDSSTEFATIVRRIETDDELYNPNKVKVALDRFGYARWFSRYPIPFLQNVRGKSRVKKFKYWGHVGVYLFRRSGLRLFGRWSSTSNEKAESLEQLRILENGGRIMTYESRCRTVSVDSLADLKKIDRLSIEI